VLENDTSWTVTGVTLAADLFDTGSVGEANLAGYRSLEIECRLFGNGADTAQCATTRISKGASDLNSQMQPVAAELRGFVNNLALDSWAPLAIIVTAQWGVANAACEAYTQLTTLELM
jgi:hypothetical protein